jgi:hypothetical protein
MFSHVSAFRKPCASLGNKSGMIAAIAHCLIESRLISHLLRIETKLDNTAYRPRTQET